MTRSVQYRSEVGFEDIEEVLDIPVYAPAYKQRK
jgi:hypothetical protein